MAHSSSLQKYLLVVLCGAGCSGIDYAECTAPLSTGTHACLERHDGMDRGFLVHVPPHTGPIPAVVSLHGRKDDPSGALDIPRLVEKADREKFLVVAPQGVEKSWNAGGCCGAAYERGVDDVGFVDAVLDRVARLTDVDPDRVYVTGFSNGGRLAHRIGCELADRIAAIAPVAGPLTEFDQATGERVFACTPSRPMPIITIHGTEDTCTPIAGGDGADTTMNPAYADVVQRYVDANQCGSSTTEMTGSTSCTSYSECGCGADVVACRTRGAGHIWPGGDPYTFWRVCGGDWVDDFVFTDRMWDFFVAHPR